MKIRCEECGEETELERCNDCFVSDLCGLCLAEHRLSKHLPMEFSRQAAILTDAVVFASLVPAEGDGRSRLLAALNHLNPPEDWFEEAAKIYGGMINEH